jgi:transcription antitermination factor NusG
MEDFKWYVMSLNRSKAFKVKMIVEQGVKALSLEHRFDKFIVLAGYKIGGGLFSGGLLSGYALIRCVMCDEIYYLVTFVPQVYGILTSKKDDDDKLVVKEISDDDVNNLIHASLHKEGSLRDLELNSIVRINDGPFGGFNATLLSIGKERAFVEVIIMGRKIKASIEINFLEKR